jgi:hypothetical protein
MSAISCQELIDDQLTVSKGATTMLDDIEWGDKEEVKRDALGFLHYFERWEVNCEVVSCL